MPESLDVLWDHTPHRHTLTALEGRIDYLEHRLEKLTLINRALWETIQQQHALPNDHLVAKVAEIDLRDGHLDGQVTLDPVCCPACGRKTSRHRRRCVYCAEEIPADLFSSD